MKKSVVILMASLLTSVANAQLTRECQQNLEKRAASYNDTFNRFAAKNGEITKETAEFLLKGWDNTAEMTALTCAGLKQIELQRSVAGRLGLISEERADQVTAAVYNEALNYYQSLKVK